MDNRLKCKRVEQARKDSKNDAIECRVQTERLQKQLQEKLELSRQKLYAKESSDRKKTELWFQLAFEHGGLWLSHNVIEEKVNPLSATKAKAVLKAQINIWTKVLHCSCDQLRITNASVSELKDHLIKLIETEPPVECEDLYELIRDPETLTGLYIAHRWADSNNQRTWWHGQILEFINDTKEFKVLYEDEESHCYLQPSEFITDLIRGDLEILQQ